MSRRRKARGGSQIAELAPSLMILFIVVLFPMLDIMYLGLGYCMGWYLNHMTSRGCSTISPFNPPLAAGVAPTLPVAYPASVITNLNNAWLSSSFSSWCGATLVANSANAVAAGATTDPTSNNNNYPAMMVEATTSVQIHPFFTLPVFPLMNNLQVDGLTRPVTFTYLDRVPLQENGIE